MKEDTTNIAWDLASTPRVTQEITGAADSADVDTTLQTLQAITRILEQLPKLLVELELLVSSLARVRG